MLRWVVSRGWHGWVVLLAVVVAFDVAATALGGETMTDAARRWLRHGTSQWLAVPLVVYLVLHLTVMPWRYDPLDRTFVWLRRKIDSRHQLTRDQMLQLIHEQETQNHKG
jgi:hypothetical protein